MTKFEKVTDINYLKTKIKPISKKLIDGKRWRKTCKNVKGIKFPYIYYLDLVWLCKQYGAKFKINIGKYGNDGYSRRRKEIYMTIQKEDILTSREICKIFTHELAHRIQHSIMKKKFAFKTYKNCLKYERTAERLAYFINNTYFKHLWNIQHSAYKAYISKEDIKFLKENWKGCLKKKY